MSTPRSNQAVYQRVFLLSAGPPPWPCFVCGGDVLNFGRPGPGQGEDPHFGVVHHRDGVPTNNAPENLVAGHWNCHVSHHLTGREVTEATREQRRTAGRARRVNPSQRAQIAATVARRWETFTYGARPRRLTLTTQEIEQLRSRWAAGFDRVRDLEVEFNVSQRLMQQLVDGLTRTRRCRKGHEMTESNVYVERRTGATRCRRCHLDRQRAYDARKRISSR